MIFLKVVNIIKELEGPSLIKDSMLLSRDQIEVEISNLRNSWGTQFDDLAGFPDDEIRNWLVDFVNENEEQMTTSQ
jgi:hypothetical protein|uniref:Uncharacterized protein n=1 Tax=Picea glauca TaxID=3330 RepID=A0A101M380_PICGL|nr:hypothetical protein ABT39_MTgene3307 [Picea glauca]QHR88587.1 hypothetical protein Q903MT_gene2601 [Picea sitchensis]